MNMNLNKNFFIHILLSSLALLVGGCVAALEPIPSSFPREGAVAFGRVKVILTGPTTRWYQPEIQFIELHNQDLDERFRLDIGSKESLFAISLPEGAYKITRVQIREGGFRGMAELSASFHIDSNTVHYLGTWTFEVASPFYNRDLVMTVSSEMIQAVAEASVTFQDFKSRPVTASLAQPESAQVRLYEVMPYPRMRYFRRHPAL